MSSQPHCAYRLTEDHLHEITFMNNSRQAVDEGIQHLDRIFRQTPPGEIARIISDNTGNKSLPLSYTVNRARIMLNALPQRPPVRVAMLGDGFLDSMVDTLVRTVMRGRDRVRFFKPGDAEKMIEWLQRDD